MNQETTKPVRDFLFGLLLSVSFSVMLIGRAYPHSTEVRFGGTVTERKLGWKRPTQVHVEKAVTAEMLHMLCQRKVTLKTQDMF